MLRRLVTPSLPVRRGVARQIVQNAPISLRSRSIKLLVCDMAGTTVDEGGLVYQVLRTALNQHQIPVTESDMCSWHGAQKLEVITHFVTKTLGDGWGRGKLIAEIDGTFLTLIEQAYFERPNAISLIDPSLPQYFAELRKQGILIGLNTGYPAKIQDRIVKTLELDKCVDAWVSSENVRFGRPFPYMIHHLMERLAVRRVDQVAKVGDSVRDMEEGVNSGCSLVVGVLSGADDEAALAQAGASYIVPNIVQIPII